MTRITERITTIVQNLFLKMNITHFIEMPMIIAVGQKGELMGCELYKVMTGTVDVARYMPLETALILIKALMMDYYAEPDIEYTIKREGKTDED